MKFTAPHYASLKTGIQNWIAEKGIKISDVKDDLKNKSEQYFLWTIFWNSNWSAENREIADQYKDAHTETALRSIVKELLTLEK